MNMILYLFIGKVTTKKKRDKRGGKKLELGTHHSFLFIFMIFYIFYIIGIIIILLLFFK